MHDLSLLKTGMFQNPCWTFLVGASYRFAPKWRAGVEARFHNDYSELNLRNQIQRATFVGPNLQYATKDWWATLSHGVTNSKGVTAWAMVKRSAQMLGSGIVIH
jgi:hypothetical protein